MALATLPLAHIPAPSARGRTTPGRYRVQRREHVLYCVSRIVRSQRSRHTYAICRRCADCGCRGDVASTHTKADLCVETRRMYVGADSVVSTRGRWRDEGFECVLLRAALEAIGIAEDRQELTWAYMVCSNCDRIWSTEVVAWYDDSSQHELNMHLTCVSDFLHNMPAVPRTYVCPVAPGACNPEPEYNNEDLLRCKRRGLPT